MSVKQTIEYKYFIQKEAFVTLLSKNLLKPHKICFCHAWPTFTCGPKIRQVSDVFQRWLQYEKSVCISVLWRGSDRHCQRYTLTSWNCGGNLLRRSHGSTTPGFDSSSSFSSVFLFLLIYDFFWLTLHKNFKNKSHRLTAAALIFTSVHTMYCSWCYLVFLHVRLTSNQ